MKWEFASITKDMKMKNKGKSDFNAKRLLNKTSPNIRTYQIDLDS